MGIMLAAWLLWGAGGALVVGRSGAVKDLPSAMKAVVKLATFPGIALLASLIGARCGNYVLAVVVPQLARSLGLADSSLIEAITIAPGQMLALHQILGLGFIATMPPALVAGAQFAATCRAYIHPRLRKPGTVGRAYALDAVGHLLGGTVLAWLALQLIDPFVMVVVVGLANLSVASALIWAADIFPSGRRYVAFSVVTVVALATIVGASATARWSVQMRWYRHELLASRRTVYGDLAITRFGPSGIYVYSNGLPMASSPPPQSLELAVDFALLQHPRPQQVLMVGGGLTGGLAAVLRHSPARVDYLELDPAIFSFVSRWLAPADTVALADPRVHCISGDGRLMMKHWLRDASARRYDAVVLLLPPPSTAQLNRFYTRQWFQQVRRILAPEGIVAWQLPSSDIYLQGPLRHLNAIVFRTARDLFPSIALLPGEEMTLVAGRSDEYLTQDWSVLFQRAQQRGLDSDIFWAWLPDKLNPSTLDYVREQIEGSPSRSINTDERPLAYFYHQAWWLEHLHRGWGQRLSGLARIPVAYLWGVVAVLLMIWSGISLTRRGRGGVIPGAVAVAGLCGMGGEMVLLLAFQSYYGYVYQQIGIIIGVFMIGLAAGSWAAGRWLYKDRPRAGIVHCLTAIRAAGAGFLALMPYLISVLWARATAPWAEDIVADLVFPLLAGALGLWIGGQFPIATALWAAREQGPSSNSGGGPSWARFLLKLWEGRPRPESRPAFAANAASADNRGGDAAPTSGHQARSAALLYAADLIGAAGGALVSGTLLVPIWGMTTTCWLMAALAVVASILVLRSRQV